MKLVRGELPELLIWVHAYGESGATLTEQPEEIWTHPASSAIQVHDGGWHVVLPLWTTDESPSDLSVEVIVEPDGSAEVHDLHVL